MGLEREVQIYPSLSPTNKGSPVLTSALGMTLIGFAERVRRFAMLISCAESHVSPRLAPWLDAARTGGSNLSFALTN
jgi:hypothetical protein